MPIDSQIEDIGNRAEKKSVAAKKLWQDVQHDVLNDYPGTPGPVNMRAAGTENAFAESGIPRPAERSILV